MTDTAPEVTTNAGPVRGFWREGSAAFLGIPFAEPPVGALRFAAPVPRAPWDGVRDAIEYGATPQRQTLSEVTIIPEPSIPGDSTLNVNVFAPRPGEPDAGLPVLVWIHGGGYVAGSPASPWYDGTSFNRDGVVTVSVSYRLGFDGFGWIEDAPHNRGVLDWILALEWVRDNIAAFGGNPARVTIAGQSAGGAAVFALLAVPRAAGLFQRAISLSGLPAVVPLDRAQRYASDLAALADVPPTREGLSRIDELSLLKLQRRVGSVPMTDTPSPDPFPMLREMVNAESLHWAPIVDGDLLPEPIVDALAHGVASETALMLGTTDHEFNFAISDQLAPFAGVDQIVVLAKLGLSPEAASSYVASHPGVDTARLAGQCVTDAMFRARNRHIAELRAESGAPTWVYRFSWLSPTIGQAMHCLDVPFFFDCLESERVGAVVGGKPPVSLVADVHGAAVRFIRGEEPGWPAYTTTSRTVRAFNTPSSTMEDGYRDVAVLV